MSEAHVPPLLHQCLPSLGEKVNHFQCFGSDHLEQPWWSAFSMFGQKTWHQQLKKGEGYFISLFQRFQSRVCWLQGRNIIAEGHSRRQLLTLWQLRSRAQGKDTKRKHPGTRYSPQDHAIWLTQKNSGMCFTNLSSPLSWQGNSSVSMGWTYPNTHLILAECNSKK